MPKKTDTRDLVAQYLDEVCAAGEPIPSLRQIRNRIGQGSSTTILDAVRLWRNAHLPPVEASPDEFTPEQKEHLATAVWAMVAEVIRSRTEAAQKAIQAQAEADAQSNEQLLQESREAVEENDRLREEAAELRSKNIALRNRVSALEAELEETKKALAETRSVEKLLRVQYGEELQAAAAARREVEVLKSLLPLIPDTFPEKSKKYASKE